MRQISYYLSSLCLSTTLVITAAGAGCAGRVRVYDEYHSDWHRWDHNEDREYRRYLSERHEGYRNYSKLDRDEQKNYWDWRHGDHR